jgi:hypothetical protein
MEVIIATGRFKDRATFDVSQLGDLGPPPKAASQRQKKLWADFANEFPWLRESDRAAIFALCVVRARIEDEPDKCDAKLLKQYLDGLKAIGGTPGERSRMPKTKDEDNTEADDGESYVN